MAEERGTSGNDHDHDHDHDRTFQPDIEDLEPSRHELMTYAMKELLIEKGHVTDEEIRKCQDKLESIEPAQGSRVIAKAWTDAAFKRRLLDDGNAALAELGIDSGGAV